MTQKDKTYYLIHYRDPQTGQMLDLKAKTVMDSSLGLSFVKISDFIFDTSSIVLKPSEEQLKKRLENVKSLHLSLYSIVSIEELGLENQGLSFKKDKSNLVVLPQEGSPSPSK